MRLLLFAINSLNEEILYNRLQKMGHQVLFYSTKCDDYIFDSKVINELMVKINDFKAEAVVSFDYIPLVSLVCDVVKIPYYSWGYDSPQLTLYAKTVMYDVNHIGLFDRYQVDFLRSIGYENVYHVPLCVDVDYFEKSISDNMNSLNCFADRGFSDVSFVGSLYTDKRKCNLYDVFRDEALKKGENIEIWQELDYIIASFMFKYNCEFSDENVSVITDFLHPYMLEHSMGLGENYFQVDEIITKENILEKKITADERMILMKSISGFCRDNDYSFALYTSSDTKDIPELNRNNRGIVDYKTQMPVVFKRSRININTTLRSIHSGIPLRALDIMGSGGFLLSNVQEELLENFVDGVHIATYSNPEECSEKIKYYLEHEDERAQIAINGQKRVKEMLSYETGINKLFLGRDC